jgi:hypothetical protein
METNNSASISLAVKTIRENIRNFMSSQDDQQTDPIVFEVSDAFPP